MKNDDQIDEVEEVIDEARKEGCNCEEESCERCNKLKEELSNAESKYKRALADYQNLEKRTREAKGDWIRSASFDILLRILPVFDTLQLGNKHVDNQTLKVTMQQFWDVLKAEGVAKIDIKGKKFDPNLMECVEMVEEGEDVLEEVREGYTLNDKVLRVAQVKVGKKE